MVQADRVCPCAKSVVIVIIAQVDGHSAARACRAALGRRAAPTPSARRCAAPAPAPSSRCVSLGCLGRRCPLSWRLGLGRRGGTLAVTTAHPVVVARRWVGALRAATSQVSGTQGQSEPPPPPPPLRWPGRCPTRPMQRAVVREVSARGGARRLHAPAARRVRPRPRRLHPRRRQTRLRALARTSRSHSPWPCGLCSC